MEREDGIQERSIYTEAYSGRGKYIQERVTRDSVTVKNMFVSILGCIQPDRLLPLLQSRSEGKSNDGFFERFNLAVFPDRSGGYIDVVACEKLLNKMQNIFRCLAMLAESEQAISANFTSKAQMHWNRWAKHLKTRTKTAPTNIETVLGKHAAVVARLSLIFHLIDEATTQEDHNSFSPSDVVELINLKRAIQFGELLLSHNIRIQEYAKDKSKINIAQTVLGKLAQLENGFAVRTLQRKGWATLKTPEDCQAVINTLCKHGYLREVKEKSSNGKIMYRYEIHPDFRS